MHIRTNILLTFTPELDYGIHRQWEIGANELGGTMIYLPAEDGQGLVEYALIIMLIALVLIAIVTIFGEQLSSTYSSINSGVDCAINHTC